MLWERKGKAALRMGMLWEGRERAALRLGNDLEGENALGSVLRVENEALAECFVFDLLFRNPRL